jgi:hypothetical protein
MLWPAGVLRAEIHTCLYALFGDSAFPGRSAYEWIEMLKNVWMNVTDAEHLGHP